MPADVSGDTELARRATGGDGEAFGLLFDRWLDRAFDVAWHVLHNREAAADATQEAFASAWQQIGNLRQPESFGGWLLRITRNKALNHLQKQRRSSPVGSEETLAMMDPRRTEDPSTPLDQQEHGDLVWAASAALGEEDASLLSLHLRSNLGAPELAEELGVKPNAAHQRLFRLKKRLAEAVGAWVLWRKGTPLCPELSAALEQAEATSFDGTTAKAIISHARRCESCDSSRKLLLSPEALFASLPVVAAGPVLRTRMVAALDDQGVPVHTHGDTAGHDSAPDGSEPDSQGDWDGRDGPNGSDSEARNDSARDDEPNRAEPDEPAGGDQQPETAELNGLDEPPETETLDEPDEVAAPGVPGDDGSDVGQPRRWRKAVGVVALVTVVLLGGVGALAVLGERDGDGSSDEAATQTPSAADIATEQTTTAAGDDDHDEVAETTTTDETTGPGDDVAGSDPMIDGSPRGDADPGTPAGPGTTGSSGTTGRPDTPAPEILRFTAVSTGEPCRSTVGGAMVTFSWETSAASSVTLGPAGGRAEPVSTSGTSRCAQPGSTWVLTASGPGGADAREETVVPPERTPSTRATGPGDLTNP